MTEPEPLGAMLLDIDGTLLDSNDAHARSWAETLQRHARPVAYERIRALIGKGSDKLLAELLGIDPDGVLAARLVEDRKQAFLARYLPTLAPTRGARALLLRLRTERMRLVVATSAGGAELQALLRRAGIDDLVDAAASASDVEASKPDPDIVRAALAKGTPAPGAGPLAPAAALMLGDTPYDVEAARRAGVATIALRCGGWWDDASLAGAVAIYDDPADLLEHWDESPLGRRRGVAA